MQHQTFATVARRPRLRRIIARTSSARYALAVRRREAAQKERARRRNQERGGKAL